MLEDIDIDKLTSVLASKIDVMEIKQDLTDLKELVQGLIVVSDSLAKSISDLTLEYAAISTQLSRHDRWIRQIAEKVGLNLKTEQLLPLNQMECSYLLKRRNPTFGGISRNLSGLCIFIVEIHSKCLQQIHFKIIAPKE